MKKIFLKSLVVTIITVMSISITGIGYVQAANNEPLEESKNYNIQVKDLKSDKVKKLYNLDNIKMPNKYNLKDYINIEVENQNPLGLCDIFATTECIETNYAKKKGKFYNLSERYLDYVTSKEFYGIREVGSIEKREEGDGGCVSDVIRYAEMYGIPLESEIPYKDFSKDEYSKIENAKLVATVKSAVEFPDSSDCSNDEEKASIRELAKAHIMQYGSVKANIASPNGGTEYFNEQTNSLYYKKGMKAGGHAVSIVGWDDNYSKDNFKIKPEHDGAWIVLNSWGENWGDKGYFYISYDDESLTQMYGVIDTDDYKPKTQYTYAQTLRCNQGRMITDDNGNCLANQFFGVKFNKKSEEEYLETIAVISGSSATGDPEAKAKIYVNEKSGDLNTEDYTYVGEAKNITDYVGGGIIFRLDKPLKITGNEFSIAIEFLGKNVDAANSKDKNDNRIAGNVYSNNNLTQGWQLSEYDIPIYAFTVTDPENAVDPEPSNPTEDPTPAEDPKPTNPTEDPTPAEDPDPSNPTEDPTPAEDPEPSNPTEDPTPTENPEPSNPTKNPTPTENPTTNNQTQTINNKTQNKTQTTNNQTQNKAQTTNNQTSKNNSTKNGWSSKDETKGGTPSGINAPKTGANHSVVPAVIALVVAIGIATTIIIIKKKEAKNINNNKK